MASVRLFFAISRKGNFQKEGPVLLKKIYPEFKIETQAVGRIGLWIKTTVEGTVNNIEACLLSKYSDVKVAENGDKPIPEELADIIMKILDNTLEQMELFNKKK